MKIRKPTEVPKALKTIDVKAILRKRGVYLDKQINLQLKEAARPMAKELLNARHKPAVKAERHGQFTNDQVEEYWGKQIHIVEVLEAKFENRVQQFIVKVVDNYLAHLESEIATTKSGVKKDYFSDNEDDLLMQAQLDFTPLLIDQAVLAGTEALKLINSKDVYTPFALRDQIAQNVTKFTQSMLDTDRQTLIGIIASGIQQGQSVAEIRRAIETDFENIKKVQAARITRTEVLRASNQAAIDAWEQSGMVEGKQWLTAGAVDECAQYEGQVVSLSGNFYDTGEFADGDPPLHPNCRCVVLPVLIGEKAYEPPHKALAERIKELESQIDKRTKAYKDIQESRADDELYIRKLEKYLGVDDE